MSAKADDLFLCAILRNHVSRRMIHSFANDYWVAKVLHRKDADERLAEKVRYAVFNGYQEMKQQHPDLAEAVHRGEAEERILRLVKRFGHEPAKLDREMTSVYERLKNNLS